MSDAVKCRFVPSVAFLLSVVLHGTLPGPPAGAAIYRWDNGELITDRNAEPGAGLTDIDLSYADLAGKNLARAVFDRAIGADFSGANLTEAGFHGATVADANFSGANLTLAFFGGTNLTDASFSEAVITGAYFIGTKDLFLTAEQLYSTANYQNGDLRGIRFESDCTSWDLSGKNLADANFSQSTLTGANFSQAILAGTDFHWATLTGANLSGASLTNANLAGCELTNSDLSGANLTNASVAGSTLTNSDLSGANLVDAFLGNATLTDVNFGGAIISGARFQETTDKGFTAEQLYSTASYQTGNLTSIGLSKNDFTSWNFAGKDLTGADFTQSTLTNADLADANLTNAILHSATLANANLSGANLTNAGLRSATLTNADFSGANLAGTDFHGAALTGANFTRSTANGFTADQLYSSGSYLNGDLRGIRLGGNDLTGWVFTGEDLTGADLSESALAHADLRGANLTDATLTQADLSYADLRGSRAMQSQGFASATAENAILPDGRIEGLHLDAGERLRVRDYNHEPGIPITVESAMDLDPAATLRFVPEDEVWGSTISFEPGTTVSLDGTLELLFGRYYDPWDPPPTGLFGATFVLFDWDGAVVSGAFHEVVVDEWQTDWDLSQLYTTGEVTLLWIAPEPSILLLLGTGLLAMGMYGYRRRKRTESAESR